jgi:hypothetical protein
MDRVLFLRISLLVVMLGLFLTSGTVHAQDAVKADPKHYKIVAENDSIRILKIWYGPGEKSVMHDHPSGLYVLLTDQKSRMNSPDGKTMDIHGKAGDAGFAPAGRHLPENTGDKPFEMILIEFKPRMQQSK